MREETVQLTLTRDQALVLFEFFARFEDTESASVRPPAEYLTLARIASQLDEAVVEMFDLNYVELLAAARARVAAGHEGEYPGPKVETT